MCIFCTIAQRNNDISDAFSIIDRSVRSALTAMSSADLHNEAARMQNITKSLKENLAKVEKKKNEKHNK